VSGCLLDVNVLLGCGWKSHADHPALLGWLLQGNDWASPAPDYDSRVN